MLRTCFLELMDKEAMRELEIPKWINANNKYQQQKKNSPVNGHVDGREVKKTREERSDDLALGLARLAYRCHVGHFPME